MGSEDGPCPAWTVLEYDEHILCLIEGSWCSGALGTSEVTLSLACWVSDHSVMGRPWAELICPVALSPAMTYEYIAVLFPSQDS